MYLSFLGEKHKIAITNLATSYGISLGITFARDQDTHLNPLCTILHPPPDTSTQ